MRSLLRVNEQILDRRKTMSIFCDKGIDGLEHYVKKCEEISEWFVELEEIRGYLQWRFR